MRNEGRKLICRVHTHIHLEDTNNNKTLYMRPTEMFEKRILVYILSSIGL